MKNIYQLLITCFLLSPSLLFAQQNVTGTVKSSTGEFLKGVSIIEKGSKNGTKTDEKGHFLIKTHTENAALTFSFIGYITETEVVDHRNQIDVILENEYNTLDDIVVVGYGTQKKVNISGAVNQVNSKTLANRPIANVSQGLQGLVPNLNVNFASGEPGASANINIRGITSINGGGPLILIDNVPSTSVELNQLTPQDIDNISVIKDASAAAIYGARAAFGVILITTKNGSKEGVSVSYTGNTSLNVPTVFPDKITDPFIFSKMLKLSTDNTPWNNVNYSDEYFQYAKARSDNPNETPGVRVNPNDAHSWEYMGNRDWTRYFLSDQTYSQDHTLTISGRAKKAQYYLSGNYNRQNGILKIAKDYFDRFTFRSKVNYQLTPWLNFGNNSVWTNTVRVKPTNYSIADIYNLFPTDYNFNPDGTWSNTATGQTGAKLTNGGNSSDKTMTIQSQFNTQMSLVKNILKFDANFTYRREAENYNQASIPYSIGYGPNDVRLQGDSYVNKTTNFEDYTILNAFTTFTKTWKKHDLTTIAGFNQEYYLNESTDLKRIGLISNDYPTIALAAGDITSAQAINDWAIQGLFYRLNYIYNNKYIIELNGRYDGSSRFPAGKRWGFFPSASAAWRVDQEDFMRNLRPAVSNFKLRASYGSLGNQSVANYGYVSTLNPTQGSYLIGGKQPISIATPGLVSPNYTWETVTTLNFGTDIGLLKNKINISFDMYTRNTTNMLTLGRKLPDVLGATEPKQNAADLRTKGWELSVGYQNSFKTGKDPINFNANFVLSDSRAVITRFDNPSQNLAQFRKGMALGEIWGLQSDGFFQNQEQINALDESAIIPWGALSVVPGWPKYVDLNNDGKIEKGLTAADSKDLKIIGNSSPRFNFGLDLNLNWKGFDFRAFFQGVGKRDYYPQNYLYWGFYQQPYAGGYAHLLDFYRPNNSSAEDMSKYSQAYINAGLAHQNLNAKYPVLQSWLADNRTGLGLSIPQTAYLLNAAYLRFKNLTIGYTFPNKLTQKWHLANVRIYVSGENIYEWSALKKFYDPESINVTDYTAPASNNNGYAYPWQRRYSFGINVNL